MSHYFIKKYNKKLSRGIKGLSNQLQKFLLAYHWPGNVRELEHVIENLIIRTTKTDKRLTVEQLPQNLRKKIIGDLQINTLAEDQLNLTETLKSIEKEMILKALDQNNWNVSQTARDLGIIRQSLIYRMKKLDISED
jgi:arginine utilization regulatory protein